MEITVRLIILTFRHNFKYLNQSSDFHRIIFDIRLIILTFKLLFLNFTFTFTPS